MEKFWDDVKTCLREVNRTKFRKKRVEWRLTPARENLDQYDYVDLLYLYRIEIVLKEALPSREQQSLRRTQSADAASESGQSSGTDKELLADLAAFEERRQARRPADDDGDEAMLRDLEAFAASRRVHGQGQGRDPDLDSFSELGRAQPAE